MMFSVHAGAIPDLAPGIVSLSCICTYSTKSASSKALSVNGFVLIAIPHGTYTPKNFHKEIEIVSIPQSVRELLFSP